MKMIDHLQFIVNEWSQTTMHEQLKAYAEGGGKWVQIRIKDCANKEMLYQLIKQLIAVCKELALTSIINDHPYLVKELNADGVHLGQKDMSITEARSLLGEDIIIGGTASNLDEAKELVTKGVDYIGYGPFKFTTTKKNISPVLGVAGYQELLDYFKNKGISTPVIAIGGIQQKDITPLLNAGVSGIAVSGEIANSSCIALTTRKFLTQISNYI